VRRNAALYVMLAAELGVAAMALFFFFRSRPVILAAFHDFGTEVPGPAGVALSSWFVPGALGFAGVCTAVGIAAPLRRSGRSFLVGLGLMVASIALMFAVWAAFQPLFQPA
jgi:hypothetical protein